VVQVAAVQEVLVVLLMPLPVPQELLALFQGHQHLTHLVQVLKTGLPVQVRLVKGAMLAVVVLVVGLALAVVWVAAVKGALSLSPTQLAR